MAVTSRLGVLRCNAGTACALLCFSAAFAASPKVAASLSSAFGTPALLECHFASGRSQAEAVCPSSRGALAAAATAFRAASLLEAHPLTQAFAPANGGTNGSIRVRFPMATGAAPLPGFAERSELIASLRAAAALTAARWQVAVHHHEEAMRSVLTFACSPVPGGSGQLYHDMEPRRSIAACARFGGWGAQKLLAKLQGRQVPEPPRCAGVAAQLRAAVRTMAQAMEALPGLEQALAAAGSALLRSRVQRFRGAHRAAHLGGVAIAARCSRPALPDREGLSFEAWLRTQWLALVTRPIGGVSAVGRVLGLAL